MITHLNVKAVYLSDPGNRKMVSSVEYIIGGRFVIKAMIILAGSVLMESTSTTTLITVFCLQ